jgi:hypothetical protein
VRSSLIVLGYLALVLVCVSGPVPVWVQTQITQHSGKVRITSTAADALCVGEGGVSPASGVCDGGIYAGPIIATTFSGSGASLTALPAAALTGTVAAAVQDNITRLGVITTSSIGTVALRTATSSVASTAPNTNVTMNDYAWFPNVEQDDCVGATDRRMDTFSGDAPSDTVGRFRMGISGETSCSSGSMDARWRYMTASDNPDLWVAVDELTGQIVGVWQGEDPTTGVPISVPGASSVRLEPPTIAALRDAIVALDQVDVDAIRARIRDYVIQRGWLADVTDFADLSNVQSRYRRAARLWLLRKVAEQYRVDPAELILETMESANGALVPKADYPAVLAAHLTARATRLAVIGEGNGQLR